MQQNMIEVEYPDMMDEIPEDRGDEGRCWVWGFDETGWRFFLAEGRSALDGLMV
jgi:hypothetical protein